VAELVPIKVKIVRAPDGSHGYPQFNRLPAEVRGHLDWSKFFDSHGIGWHYDKLSGFGEVDDGTVPAGHRHRNDDPDCWYGATCVPEAFAVAAQAEFPSEVEILTEAEFESFYDDRAHVNEDDESLDTDVLQGILARVQLEEKGIAPAPSAEILAKRARCLDPSDQGARGIRKNVGRKWADFKKRRGVKIKGSQ